MTTSSSRDLCVCIRRGRRLRVVEPEYRRGSASTSDILPFCADSLSRIHEAQLAV